MRSIRIEFRAVGVFESANVSRKFDGGDLHAQAETEIGRSRLARIARRLNLALDAAIAKSARNQHAGHPAQVFVSALLLEIFGIDKHKIRRAIVGRGGMREGLVDALVGVLKFNVFSNDSDRTLFFGLTTRSTNLRQSLMSGSLV